MSKMNIIKQIGHGIQEILYVLSLKVFQSKSISA